LPVPAESTKISKPAFSSRSLKTTSPMGDRQMFPAQTTEIDLIFFKTTCFLSNRLKILRLHNQESTQG
jgi:hypothetical protein